MLAEILAAPFGEHANGNAARVRRDECARRAVLLDTLKQLLLDVEALDNDFKDPIALGDAGQVVVEVAGLDARRKPLAVYGGGLGLEGLGQMAGRHTVAGSFVGGQVEQHDFRAALGEVACNGRPHHTGAEHGHAFDSVKRKGGRHDERVSVWGCQLGGINWSGTSKSSFSLANPWSSWSAASSPSNSCRRALSPMTNSRIWRRALTPSSVKKTRTDRRSCSSWRRSMRPCPSMLFRVRDRLVASIPMRGPSLVLGVPSRSMLSKAYPTLMLMPCDSARLV